MCSIVTAVILAMETYSDWNDVDESNLKRFAETEDFFRNSAVNNLHL